MNFSPLGRLKKTRNTFFPGLLYLGLISILVSGKPYQAPGSLHSSVQTTPAAVLETVQPPWNQASQQEQHPLQVAQVVQLQPAVEVDRDDALKNMPDVLPQSGMRVEDDIQENVDRSESRVVVEDSLTVNSEKMETSVQKMDGVIYAEVGSEKALASLSPEIAGNILLVEPAGCKRPIDDFNRILVSDKMLNRRTFAMLEYADSLYGGQLDITGTGIIQGSYESNGLEGADIYSGGGVVDLSVSLYGSTTVLYGEVEPLVRALRVAGFAAWFREEGEVFPGSVPHIHAVAIGDTRLSEAAAEQINGLAGYFRGYSGLLTEDGNPMPDRYDGPVVCQWMVDDGYIDVDTSQIVLSNEPENDDGWQERLREVAQGYVTTSMQESIEVARQIDFVEGDIEHPANMCGPLAAAILKDAGLLPDDMPPAYDMHNFWLANPRQGERPFSLFPDWQYEKYRFNEPINEFDFDSFPLLPADFIYTYAVTSGYDHMFVVTEVDEEGRAYTVTNQMQEDHTYLIERIMLYDPQDPTAGALKREWVNNTELGKTGLGGFAIIRRKGFSLPSGSQFAYTVRAGDTILSVASHFNSQTNGIVENSHLQNVTLLTVGQSLSVPVNLDSNGEDVPDEPRRARDVLAYTEEGRQAGPLVIKEDLPQDETAKETGVAGINDLVVLKTIAGNMESEDELSLYHSIEEIYRQAPSGDWGIYIEDLDTGMSIMAGDDIVYHPASTIKVAVGAAFMHWMDDHPDVKLSNGPVMNQRSYEQLLHAMLIKSEEEATTILINFLNRYDGYEVQTMIDSWGLDETTILPRRTTPGDMALLLKRLYRGELVSEASTQLLLEILRTPSNNDDVRLGAGMPEQLRTSLAHKPGTVFDDGWGVVSDVGVVSLAESHYVVVVLSNFVEWIDYDEAQTFIADISEAVYRYETGGASKLVVQQEQERGSLSEEIRQELQASRPYKPDADSIRPIEQAVEITEGEADWSLCQPEGGEPAGCPVKVSFGLQL